MSPGSYLGAYVCSYKLYFSFVNKHMFPLLCIIMSIKVELLLGYMYLVLKLYALSLTLYYIIIIVFYACEFGSFGDLFTQWGIDLFSPPDPFYRYFRSGRSI